VAGDETHPEGERRLSSVVRMGVQDDVLYVGFGSIQRRVPDREMWRPVILAASHWTTPTSRTDLTNHLVDDHGVSHALADEATRFLEDGGYLSPPPGLDWSDRYSRHLLHYELQGADPLDVQARLTASHVVIVGCGGIGNLVAAQLACAGVGQLTLVDDDLVELTNLTRQLLFTEADVGRPKAPVLAERVTARNSTVTVDAVPLAVEEAGQLDQLGAFDLMVVSADAAGIVELTNRYCVEREACWITVGYVNDIAVWGPLVVPGVTGCWSCGNLVARPDGLDGDLPARLRHVNGRYRSPSYGPVNMAAAGLACLDIVRQLGGFGQPASHNHRLGLWSHNLELERQDCSRRPDCPVCSPR
jgi:molybdopterin-synthase adenylyltransferase